jgi:hypothetical protein
VHEGFQVTDAEPRETLDLDLRQSVAGDQALDRPDRDPEPDRCPCGRG